MSQQPRLKISNFNVSIDSKKILNGIDLTINPGEVHAVMGPNGSGKSTLAYALMGHPAYAVTSGTAVLDDKNVVELPFDGRAKSGLFLAFQYPHEVEGVPLRDFLRQSYNALYGGTDKQLGMKDFRALLDEKAALLGVKPDFVERSVNVGFSGGEKKRAEVLQLAVLQPKMAILDEIDSGLDIDALRMVCEGIAKVRADNPEMSLLVITHYQRILKYLKPDFVHVMQDGLITQSGDRHLAKQLEEQGYQG